MRELITRNPTRILKEITRLIDNKSVVTLYLKGNNPWQAKIMEVSEGSRLHIEKPKNFQFAPHTSYFLLYPPSAKGSGAMHGFEAVALENRSLEIILQFPKEIFEVFQRKHKRMETTGNSRMKFVHAASKRPACGIIKDISLEGACLLLDAGIQFNKGEKIHSLSMSLCLRNNTEETDIHLDEAEVIRISFIGDKIQEIALHFLPPENERETMQEYLDTRLLEENLGEELPEF